MLSYDSNGENTSEKELPQYVHCGSQRKGITVLRGVSLATILAPRQSTSNGRSAVDRELVDILWSWLLPDPQKSLAEDVPLGLLWGELESLGWRLLSFLDPYGAHLVTRCRPGARAHQGAQGTISSFRGGSVCSNHKFLHQDLRFCYS